jgi:hypothetical protein
MAYAALENPTIKPAVRIITAITQSSPVVVTTSFDHGYGIGLIVRLRIPPYFGMQQANKLQGTVIAVTSDTLTLDIDTTNFDPFVLPPNQVTPLVDTQTQFAQVVPVGEVNTTLQFAWRDVLL